MLDYRSVVFFFCDGWKNVEPRGLSLFRSKIFFWKKGNQDIEVIEGMDMLWYCFWCGIHRRRTTTTTTTTTTAATAATTTATAATAATTTSNNEQQAAIVLFCSEREPRCLWCSVTFRRPSHGENVQVTVKHQFFNVFFGCDFKSYFDMNLEGYWRWKHHLAGSKSSTWASL